MNVIFEICILYQIKVYRSHEKELNERRVKTIHSLFHELRHMYYEFNYCVVFSKLLSIRL